MDKPTRKITNFNFESEGAHVALVSRAANKKTVLVMKALDQEEPQPNLSSSVTDSQDGDVVKTEDEINKGTNKMAEQTKELNVEEQIAKAVEAQRKEVEERVAKEYEAKFEENSKELQILKGLEEKRQTEIFTTKAKEIAGVLGEDTDVEALAKGLRKAEADEELTAVVKALKELHDASTKADLLSETGVTKSADQGQDEDSQIQAIQKSMLEKDPSMANHDAYVEAYRQFHKITA